MDNTFRLDIDTGNAAFDDGHAPFEVARILREVANNLTNNKLSGTLYDINGNRVGSYHLQIEEDDE